MKPNRPIINGSDTAFTGNLKRWGGEVVDALGSLSDHPGMRIPYPFEVRRGWGRGDSVSAWGVHGGAIQVGSTIYTPPVTETLGDGRRWHMINDPGDRLTEVPLDCTVYAYVGAGDGYVAFSTDPDVAGLYVTPIAKLDGVRLVQLIVGNIRIDDHNGAIRLVSSSFTTSPVTFSERTYQTNGFVIEAEDLGGGTYNTIETNVGGIYHVSIQCTLTVPIGMSIASASVSMKDAGDNIILINELEQRYIEKMSGSSSERIRVNQSASKDFLAPAGGTYTVVANETSGYISGCVWCVHLVQEYTA